MNGVPYICYCMMTDQPHVIADGIGCGQCTNEDKARSLTAENVDAAFRHFKSQIEDDETEDDEGG